MKAIGVLKRTALEISEDRILTESAGITFFALLAIFPGLTCLVWIYGFFAHRESISHVLNNVAPFLPGGAVTVLKSEIHRLIAEKASKVNFMFVLNFVVSIWSASGGAKALMDGLNIACETKETRGFLILTANALIFTVVTLALGLVAIAFGLLLPWIMIHSPYYRELQVAVSILQWPVGFFCCATLIGAIYRFGPNLGTMRRQWFSWGSFLASGLWILGTIGFAWYVQNFGSYDRVYGSLGALVGFLTWIWLSLVIILSGAELNCEIDRACGKINAKASAKDPA